MLATPEQESEILAQVLSFRSDPVSFVFWAYPWGQAGTPFAQLTGPRDWQLEELKSLGEHVRAQEFAIANNLPLEVYRLGLSSGRGPGKSAFFGMAAHWHLSTHWGAMAVVIANTENQLRHTTFPEFSKWFTAAVNAHWFVVEGMKISIAPWLAQQAAKDPSQGGIKIDPEKWLAKGKTWVEDNPNAYAGEHNDHGLMVLVDEAAGVAPFVWDLSEGFFTEVNPYRFWMAASQMRNRQGRFYDIANDAQMGKGWRFRTLTTRGMQGVDQSLVESQIARYGIDSDFVRVEIMGLPPQTSEDQFIPHDAVRAAQQNDIYPDYGEPLILGVDPAPRGKTAWRFRQGRNARDCVGAATHGHWLGHDNVQIAKNILDLDSKFKPDAICIDFGMGTGVIDILKRKYLRHKIHEVKFGNAAEKKDSEYATHAIELWGRVKDWLPGGMIEKDDGEKGSLSQQLTDRGWRWHGREDNKKILETKDDMQARGVKSPDDADALACTFEVNPPRRDDFKRGGARKVEGTSDWMTEGA